MPGEGKADGVVTGRAFIPLNGRHISKGKGQRLKSNTPFYMALFAHLVQRGARLDRSTKLGINEEQNHVRHLLGEITPLESCHTVNGMHCLMRTLSPA